MVSYVLISKLPSEPQESRQCGIDIQTYRSTQQVRGPETNSSCMVKLFSTRDPRLFSGEKTVFSTNGVGKTGCPQVKIEFGPFTAAAAKLLQSCLTLCDPINGSPSGSSVPGVLQARILE